MYGVGGMISPRATPTPGQGGAPDPSLDPNYRAPSAPIAPAPVAPLGWQNKLVGPGDGSNGAAIFGQGAVDADARMSALARSGDLIGAAGAGTSALIQGAGGLIVRPAAAIAQAAGYGIGALAMGAKQFGQGFSGEVPQPAPQAGTNPPVVGASTATGAGLSPAATVVPPAASPGSAVTGRSSSVIPPANPTYDQARTQGLVPPSITGVTTYGRGPYEGQPVVTDMATGGMAALNAPGSQDGAQINVARGRAITPGIGGDGTGGGMGGARAALAAIPNNQLSTFLQLMSGASSARSANLAADSRAKLAAALEKASNEQYAAAGNNVEKKAAAREQYIKNQLLLQPGSMAQQGALFGGGFGLGGG